MIILPWLKTLELHSITLHFLMDKLLYQNHFVPLVSGCLVIVFPKLQQRSYHMSAILHVRYLMQSPDIPYKLNQGTINKKTGNFLYSEAKIRSKTKSNNWKNVFVNCSMSSIKFTCMHAYVCVYIYIYVRVCRKSKHIKCMASCGTEFIIK